MLVYGRQVSTLEGRGACARGTTKNASRQNIPPFLTAPWRKQRKIKGAKSRTRPRMRRSGLTIHRKAFPRQTSGPRRTLVLCAACHLAHGRQTPHAHKECHGKCLNAVCLGRRKRVGVGDAVAHFHFDLARSGGPLVVALAFAHKDDNQGGAWGAIHLRQWPRKFRTTHNGMCAPALLRLHG